MLRIIINIIPLTSLMIGIHLFHSDGAVAHFRKTRTSEIKTAGEKRMRPLILNGIESELGKWPWQVALSTCNKEKCDLYCGGALVAPKFILTAAHCLTFEQTKTVRPIDALTIYLGKHYRENSKDDSSVQMRKASSIHLHLSYNPTTNDNDIGIIELSQAVLLSDRVNTISLPLQNDNSSLNDGSIGWVTGWGVTSNNQYAERLQEVSLQVISNKDCTESYKNQRLFFEITDNMFCAGYKKGLQDSCDGDSGGPMVFNSTGSWTLEGLVSWGSPFGCGFPDQYGGYVQVNKFTDWIKSIIS